MSALTQSNAWKALKTHHSTAASLQMRDLFAKDSGRFARFSVKFNDILLGLLQESDNGRDDEPLVFPCTPGGC